MRRLSPGTLIVGVFAILFGLVGAYAVKRALQRPAETAVEEPKPVEQPILVPVASLDLPAGRTVVEEDVMTISMTREALAKSKFPPLVMQKVGQITGRVLREPHKRGQPFEPSGFYPKGMGPSIVENLQPGERAVTIAAQPDAVDGTFLTPGAIVDVLFRANADEKLELPDATVTLLSRVRVLAVDHVTVEGESPSTKNQPAQKAQPITLAVNENQARALKVVEGRGTLSVALRPMHDMTLALKEGPTTLRGLLGLKEPEKEFVSEIYRGVHLTTLTFRGGRREKLVLDAPYGLPVNGSHRSDAGSEYLPPADGRNRTGNVISPSPSGASDPAGQPAAGQDLRQKSPAASAGGR
jgi:Flp pilus assembly protein CpaB